MMEQFHDHGARGAAGHEELTDVAENLQAILDARGIHAALGYLNSRTRFRFTGLYHAAPPLLCNVHLFDRENPNLNASGNVSQLGDTYCSITCATDAPFHTPDAQEDSRLTDHAARDSVISYAGVPIRTHRGSAWGTLCHFDVRPRLMPPAEVPVLESVVPIFAGWLREQGRT